MLSEIVFVLACKRLRLGPHGELGRYFSTSSYSF